MDNTSLDFAGLLNIAYYTSAMKQKYHVVRINTDYPAEWLFDSRVITKLPPNYLSTFFHFDRDPQNFIVDLFIRPMSKNIKKIQDISLVEVDKPSQPGHFRLAINEVYGRIPQSDSPPLIL